MTVKAIGFDLDDTLYSRGDFYRYVFEVMQSSIIKLDTSFERFFEIFQYFSDNEYDKFIRRQKDKDAYKNDRVIDTYQELGVTISQDEAIIFNALYLYFRDKISLRKGVKKLFDLLLEHGYELFVLTNGPSADQRNKLKQLNINQYIMEENWFISDELDYTKPDIEIFKKVEKKLGFESEEILYIGDDYVNDIVGASNAEWKTIFMNIHGNEEIIDNKTAVTNFSEIIHYLKNDENFFKN